MKTNNEDGEDGDVQKVNENEKGGVH